MPELPEVETVCRALNASINQQCITQIIIRKHELRWPIPSHLGQKLDHQRVTSIMRRGKYILMTFETGTLIIHLGMSGRIHLLPISPVTPPSAHDHCDFYFSNNILLRYHDPRRFGTILWTEKDINLHPLLAKLGPEPLSSGFNGHYLYEKTRRRQSCIKTVLMNSQLVTGIGNIYANEALYLADIQPNRIANQLDLEECKLLSLMIKKILRRAIKAGGTTLNDFFQSDGKPGYFFLQLAVYGKAGQACQRCQHIIQNKMINKRSSFFCNHCQK